MKKIGLSLMTAILGGAIAVGAYKMVETKTTEVGTFEDRQKVYFASNHIAPLVSSAGTVDFTQAAAAVTPAVVYIRTTYSSSQSGGGQDQMEQMFGDMFGMRRRQQSNTPQRASGSGVIISTDGYIVTNNHVVEKADKIEVTTNDKRTFLAKVIGTDPNTDLALIKVSTAGLPIVKFGNSDEAKVGEWVLAVGNPFNLTSTVTAGIVSAKGRSVGIIGSQDNDDDTNPFSSPNLDRSQAQTPVLNRGIESFIQTDAVINPGNSGGALVNTKGELIGINSAILSHTGSYEGYGFAIPINLAKKVLNDIEKFGKVKRGYVGVQFRELNPDAAQELNVKTTNGLYVNELVQGGGAQQAGIRKGDIITKVDGNTVYESSDLQEKVARLQPGDKINLTVLRDGKEQTFAVTLKADNSNVLAGGGRTKSAEEIYNNLGASFAPLSSAQKQKYNMKSGVLVTQVRPGRMFDQLGIEEGSVITSINKVPVNSPEAIDKAISNVKDGILIITGVSPDGSSFTNRYKMDR
ncbi:trypsin-like peptidase domain-containing protein [Mucilaginibacter arboris]|uniref:PDZ domain-containing protein n=1 Tax=Mucilaginibacter arboris TaxID=2682090 RepID=A0A7K1SZP5_9SPHI|nr:trypsin-like peptidase domain-containing protein [Mucilaginibacter arboris]MVN22786.1 PDZ domain-containing protein [Mucilaginibacter arboris]